MPTLLEEPSPYGNIVAVVEETENTVYLYLYGPQNTDPSIDSPFLIRSCWVCNTVPVVEKSAEDMNSILATMNQGETPVMPARHCLHATTGLHLNKNELHIIWFEESDCAALIYEGDILAVITPWAIPSASKYVGYAREFKGEPFLGVGALDEILAPIAERIHRAHSFWARWSDDATWDMFLEQHMEILEKHFGTHIKYFTIDGGRFPPKSIALFKQDNSLIFVTIGMSILAQPRVELYTETPEKFRRIELAMKVDASIVEEVALEQIGEFISGLVSMPWEQLCWFGHGHTIETELFSSFGNHRLIFENKDLDSVILPHSQEDPVTLLWLVPIKEKPNT